MEHTDLGMWRLSFTLYCVTVVSIQALCPAEPSMSRLKK